MIIHILKLIRSRMGGSGWILAELLVVFVVIWFMTSYFLMMGKSWYEPVGYDLEGVYHAVLAVRPSNSPSFVTYEEPSAATRRKSTGSWSTWGPR